MGLKIEKIGLTLVFSLMFTRSSIINELKEWGEKTDRKPLILRGARQVGKTTIVKLFAENFDVFINLNLEKSRDIEIFEKNLDIEDLVNSIFLYKDLRRDKNQKTLLFIDEIQNSPKAIAMLRYFNEEAKEIHVIAAGSLLESMMGEHFSFPVGRVEYLFMYPLTFIEFLEATNETEALKLINQIPLPHFAYEKLLKLFHEYTLIGGMPEVLAKYIETKDLVSLNPIYENLLEAYIDDAEKYTKRKELLPILRHVINAIPLFAGKRIKFQNFGDSNYSSKHVKELMQNLEKAMLINLIYPTTSTEIPATTDFKKSPKLQFLDTGLINYFAGLQRHYIGIEDLHGIYQGLIIEHIVMQELKTLVKTRNLHFWVREKKQSNSEVDFVFAFQKFLIPIEVKSGKSGTLRSLHEFMDRTNHHYAVRLYANKLSIDDVLTSKGKHYKLLNLPYFLISEIDRYLEWFVKEA